MVSDIRPALPYFAFFVMFLGRKCCKLVSDIFMALNLTTLKHLQLFSLCVGAGGFLKVRVIQKSVYTIPKLKTAIRSEVETIFTETLKQGSEKCFSFPKICGLWEQCVEHVSF
jgi:hypothetical protein